MMNKKAGMKLENVTDSNITPEIDEEKIQGMFGERGGLLKFLSEVRVDEEVFAKVVLERYALKFLLQEYKDLEEQGLLLRLPVKVGDTVWFNTYKRGERMGVQSHKVEEVRVRILIERDYAEPYTEIPDYEFGKTVFLTREEAEQKLKEMEG